MNEISILFISLSIIGLVILGIVLYSDWKKKSSTNAHPKSSHQ